MSLQLRLDLNWPIKINAEIPKNKTKTPVKFYIETLSDRLEVNLGPKFLYRNYTVDFKKSRGSNSQS